MSVPKFIAVGAMQVVTSFKQILHCTPVSCRMVDGAWRPALVFSEGGECGVVSMEGETLGRFWGAERIVWPLLDVSEATELGIELQPGSAGKEVQPQPDGALYAKFEEGERFRGVYLSTWQEVDGQRQPFRMMSFKDPVSGNVQAVQWDRWGLPRLIWRGERGTTAAGPS